MKNVFNFALCLAVLCFGFGCKENPLSKFTQPKYNCRMANEPEPKTSEEFFARAQKHIEMYSGGGAASLDDCAFAALDEAIRLNPKNLDALRVRGYGYRQRKQYDLALADFDKAIQIEPNNPENFFFRSLTNQEKGLLDNAIEDISKAIDLTPKENKRLQVFLEKRVEFYKEKGDFENLIKYYTEQIQLKPDANDFFNRAGVYVKKGDFENAIKDYTEAIRLDPDDANNYYVRADVYYKMGKRDLAQSDTKKGDELRSAEKGNSKTSSTPKPSSTSNSSNTISGGVLNGKATNLVKPEYPLAAKAVRANGTVNVQVMIDENGNVISASAVSGHTLLRSSAEKAAKESKFNPTMLSGQKVRVSGVIVYNFTSE
ncbi:MAG TPA: TonB family protein [Pyrinomonadaceae bacterium]|nr:TonB family protein [Pyrinomonadaceae bacterium]